MTDSSASEPSGDSQKKDAKHLRPCGRPRKRPAEEVEPFEEDVLVLLQQPFPIATSGVTLRNLFVACRFLTACCSSGTKRGLGCHTLPA